MSTQIGDGRETGHPTGPPGRPAAGAGMPGGRDGGRAAGGRRLRPWRERLARSPRARKRALWTLTAAALLAAIVLAFRPSPVPVQIESVERGPLESTIDAEGRTRLVDRFTVAAPTGGRLERITLREGDDVAGGEIVARVSPAPLDPQVAAQARTGMAAARARLDEANARVAQAADAAAQAARTTARIQAVVAAGGMSIEARERAELDLSAAQREHEAALARAAATGNELAAAQAVLVDVDPQGGQGQSVVAVRAPATGRVLRVLEPDDRVVPAGTPLLEIGGGDLLEIVVDVLSTDAVRIVPGSPVRIEGWGGDTKLEGRVRLVEPAAFTKVSALGVEEQRVNVVVDLLDRPAALGDGYQVEARIVTWRAEDVVKVPTSALFRSGDAWAVFALEGDRSVLRQLRLGNRGIREAEVLDGVAPGERVVVFPSDLLREGQRVRDAG